MTFARCRFVALSAAVTLIVSSGIASADPKEDKSSPRMEHAQSEKGEGVALCGVGAATSVTDATPPNDDDVDTNLVVLSANLVKRCPGILIGTFSSEVKTPKEGDFIHVDMFAVCVSKGGQDKACTPGDRRFASPGHTFFRNSVGETQTHSFMAMWTDLSPGKWRIEVAAGGNGSAQLGYRAIKAEAYSKQ